MFDASQLTWSPEALPCTITNDRIEMTTRPKTDLWQRTFVGGGSDNAPVLQMKTSEPCFTFTAKAEFHSDCRFDQCGLVVHLNADSWLKTSIERENGHISHLGGVVTNHGYSDWSCQEVDVSVRSMWYRLTRNGADFLMECSPDGERFSLLRMCHLFGAEDEINVGLYACSPGESSFTATFTHMDFKPMAPEDLDF